jgi:hypothetical protein
MSEVNDPHDAKYERETNADEGVLRAKAEPDDSSRYDAFQYFLRSPIYGVRSVALEWMTATTVPHIGIAGSDACRSLPLTTYMRIVMAQGPALSRRRRHGSTGRSVVSVFVGSAAVALSCVHMTSPGVMWHRRGGLCCVAADDILCAIRSTLPLSASRDRRLSAISVPPSHNAG